MIDEAKTWAQFAMNFRLKLGPKLATKLGPKEGPIHPFNFDLVPYSEATSLQCE
jgi:hypothetical protein